MLMEDETEEKSSTFQHSLALQDTERSFYELIHENYPSSSSFSSSPDQSVSGSFSDYTTFSSGSSYTAESHWSPVEYNPPIPPYQSSVNSAQFQFFENPMPAFLDSALQFQRGMEEGSMFLPNHAPFIIHQDNTSFSPKAPEVVIKREPESEEGEYLNWEELQDGSSRKEKTVCMDDTELSELFDKVLLGTGLGKGKPPNDESNMCGGGKLLFKRGNDDQSVDLRTPLMLCAQAIASDNHSFANQLLKQIKQHSSSTGDATQRLAHYFGNALEARLGGTGFKVYSGVPSSKTNSAQDMIKAYQVYASVCPFEKLAIIFANNSICNRAMQAETLHIIDFGILYGFKWPALIERISKRAGGPPKLRITGIELPRSGFKPKETERRLASYCNRFNVPFEFNVIVNTRWETITVEDLKIEKNEFVAVNCLFRFENLLDETLVSNNPKDAVLALIKKANPAIFVHSIINGSYNAPFFVTRFREALFHYSALFDMLHTNVAPENPTGFMFENEVFGRQIMNIIACEGCERVERPESYKQWQLRNMRNGFKQLPLDHQIVDKLKGRLIHDAHNTNFMLEVDGNWVLQGWKGRILHASSCWVPA
ncbi:hypothetical protein VNO77_29038 [Canavalia gladiata]|uniref:Uncharacterized protein n=1 Tax=Canavalia gladiata TaxID=3824 RepID=A0AAN9KW56_CANGL